MDWIKLKERFPNSHQEIREYFLEKQIQDGTILIQEFLKTKGYNIRIGFIKELKDYERREFEK